MQKITPFLWFDDKAEEAVNFYTSIFKNSKILSVTRYGRRTGKSSPDPCAPQALTSTLLSEKRAFRMIGPMGFWCFF